MAAVEIKHFIEAAIGQRVSVQDCKFGLSFYEGTIRLQSPGAAQQLMLERHCYFDGPFVCVKKFSNTFTVSVGVYEHFINSVSRAPLQPDAKQWSALDLNQAFGNVIRQWTQPCTVAGRQKKALHFCSV
jgi:hypothetical protein